MVIIYLIAIVASIFLLLILAKKSKLNRHKANIKQARIILNKVKSIDHPGAKIKYLRKIDPFVFEELLLESFKDKGFEIIRNKRYTGDGGIDGQVIKDEKLYLVQAKRYSSAINPSHVQEFAEVIKKRNAFGGFFVHTGRTGKTSYEKLPGQNIEIISGDRLIKLIS